MGQPRRPRVLLADDHRLVAEGLKSLLAPDFDLVGVVEDGRARVEAVRVARPATREGAGGGSAGLYHEGVVEASPSLRQVGRRRPARPGLDRAAGLLRLVVDLRGDRPFLPRGVHRFESFEESQAWSIRMMARPSSRVRPSSKTS